MLTEHLVMINAFIVNIGIIYIAIDAIHIDIEFDIDTLLISISTDIHTDPLMLIS